MTDDPLARLLELDLELPEQGTGIRAARRAQRRPLQAEPLPDDGPAAPSGPSRRWMAGFASLLVVALVAGVALTYVGVVTVRDSTDGRTVATSDPTEPGFEGFLEPTPTLLVVHEDDGELRSLALLGLGSHDAGGSVLLVPPWTIVESESFSGPLSVGYAFGGGVDAIFHLVEQLVGVGITERVVVDDARWASLTAGVAPIPIDNPDTVEGFESGTIELPADRVAEWLTAVAPAESDLGRMYRIERFWEAWLAEVAGAGDPSVVPGELDSGLGRFVRGMAAGAVEIATLPVVEQLTPEGQPAFALDPDPAVALIARLIPFPRGHVEGARTRVRLLDGTGDPDHALAAAPLIVPAGAEIVIVGNAESFETPRQTEVRYHDDSQAAAAERLRDALGAGVVVDDARQVDSFDVTIVLGTDV